MTDSQPDVQKRIDQSTLPGESNVAGKLQFLIVQLSFICVLLFIHL